MSKGGLSVAEKVRCSFSGFGSFANTVPPLSPTVLIRKTSPSCFVDHPPMNLAMPSRTMVLDAFKFPSKPALASTTDINVASLEISAQCNSNMNGLQQSLEPGNRFAPDFEVTVTALETQADVNDASGTLLHRKMSTSPSTPNALSALSSASTEMEQPLGTPQQNYVPEALPLQGSLFANAVPSVVRNRLTRRRSSQKPSLNLIIEDPSPPPLSAKSPCSKAESPPFGQLDVTYIPHPSLNVTIEDTSAYTCGLSLPTAKVARRALSMNDLARHEHDYSAERKMSLASDSLLKVSSSLT